MSEKEEGFKKVKMTAYEADTGCVVNTKEHDEVLAHINDIIYNVAKKYLNFNNYDITTEEDIKTVAEGSQLEYDVYRMFVYVIDLATQEITELGTVKFGDNYWDYVTDEEKRNGYIALDDDEYIRKDAEELFQEWAKEEEGQTHVNVKEDERLKRVNMNSSEYSDAFSNFCDIITDVAQKYVDFNKYEIDFEEDADSVHEGLPQEYDIIVIAVYLTEKKTKSREWIGGVEIGDNCWNHVTVTEKRNNYVVLYSNKYIREQAEEVFKEWAKEEAEEDE